MDLTGFFSGLDELFAQKKLPAAEEYLKNHLAAAKKAEDCNYELAVLNELVGYYRSLSRIPEALEAGKQAQKIIFSPDFKDRIAAATTMLNIATALRAGGSYTEALEMYEKVENIYSLELIPGDSRFAALYNNMAQAQTANGDNDAAIERLQAALSIVEAVNNRSPEAATTHSNIALLYLKSGNKEAAAKHLQSSLSTFESLGFDDPHYPAALAASAQLLYLNGDYLKAAEQYARALEKNTAVFGTNADYVRICKNCAQAYSMAGETSEAEKMLQKARSAAEKLNHANAC